MCTLNQSIYHYGHQYARKTQLHKLYGLHRILWHCEPCRLNSKLSVIKPLSFHGKTVFETKYAAIGPHTSRGANVTWSEWVCAGGWSVPWSSKGSSGHEHTIMRPPIPCSLDWGCNEYLKTDVWEITALHYPNISTNNEQTKNKGRGHEEAEFPLGALEEYDLLETFFGLRKLSGFNKRFKSWQLVFKLAVLLKVFQRPC